MPDQTPNLAMPFIQPAQAQKHVTHNEAIELLDVVVQLTLESVGATAPPGTATEGQAWIVGDAATGDWSGQDGMIAGWHGGGWLYVTPQEGWRAWVVDAGMIMVLVGDSWQAAASLENIAGIGINASFDAINRLSVSAAATLLSHEGAGHQVKINKAAATDTASLLYQSGFSGRAELGLAGNDDLSIKVSDDGASFVNALTIPAATGHVQVDQLLRLTPGIPPVTPTAGDIYFDAATTKLRCYDGTGWQDLF
ncbi:DUF2793 domain-containing protein [Yoonia sp. SS1-5]|uniref:DUF2793 domain-containing protein n=1 Tax=Yoonia rhodophyticola TaxID=3137370 RepID=A0AAN0NJ30_9RHOB